MPEVKAVAIHGLTWNVPRIHPTHFSAQDFERLIKKSTTYRCRKSQFLSSNKIPTQHLWLDIACIDQKDEKTKMSEIGRQAKIFANADTALIWLSHHDSGQIEQNLQQFVAAIEQLESEPQIDSAKTAAEGLATILQDPWFSSLWTLQEAFLRKDALLLSLQAESVSLRGYSMADLRLLTLCCSGQLQVPSTHLQEYVPVSQWNDLVRLKDAIQKSGLGLLHSDSPIVIYTGARFRNSSFELDRIYGIMQIFDLNLGTTAEGAESQKITLVELEDQLGAALIKKWPIRSQFHIHTKAAAFGRSWRISESSQFPEISLEYETERSSADTDDWDTAQCLLSTANVHGVTWGHFTGKVCRFEELASAWKHWSSDHPRRQWPYPQSLITTTRPDGPLQRLALDATSALSEAPSSLHTLNMLNLPSDHTQHEVCSTLVQMFGERLIVLALGQGKGLILLRQQSEMMDYWHRIGICLWTAKETDDEFLLGHADDRWWDLEGLFG